MVDTKSLVSRFTLTEREATIVALVADGKGNADIGATLGITERSVKNALVHIPGKMGIADRGGSLRVRIALRAHGVTFSE